MIFKRSSVNREKRARFAHIIAGIVILIHSYEKFDSGHDSYILFGIAGSVFISIAYFHSKLEKKFPRVDGVFFIIEGILSFVISYEFFHAGKKSLPVVYLVLGIFQIILAFIKSKKGIENSRSVN